MDIEQDAEVVDDSVRGVLEAAFEEHETKEAENAEKPETPPAEKEARVRDDSGKFQKKAEQPSAAEVAKPAEKITAPNSWTAEAKADWEKLPPKVQAEIKKREGEVELGFTKMDEERSFAKSIKDVVTPYMPIIQAEGGTPITAIQSLLNTAYILRTAPVAQKTALFHQLAKEYGVDLTTATPAVQPDPLKQTQQEIADLKQMIAQQPEKLRQQQEETLIKQHIDAFAADPKNVHFEKLKPICGSLLQSGAASSLQDAYEKACRADPEIYSMLEAEKTAAAEAKRIADIRAKAEKSRNIAVSVRGNPGSTPVVNGADAGSVREGLLAAWDEHAA